MRVVVLLASESETVNSNGITCIIMRLFKAILIEMNIHELLFARAIIK